MTSLSLGLLEPGLPSLREGWKSRSPPMLSLLDRSKEEVCRSPSTSPLLLLRSSWALLSFLLLVLLLLL